MSNTVTDSTSQGSVGCPWVVVVDGGQRINITLIDFGVIANSNLDENRCQLYATIKVVASVTSCGYFVCLSVCLSCCIFLCLYMSPFCGNNLHTLSQGGSAEVWGGGACPSPPQKYRSLISHHCEKSKVMKTRMRKQVCFLPFQRF